MFSPSFLFRSGFFSTLNSARARRQEGATGRRLGSRFRRQAWAGSFLLALACSGFSQTMDLSRVDTSVQSGHFKVGGRNPQGHEISANSRYLTRDGQPWFPVMGECHFSRVPRAEWESTLEKMKAGGVQVVATYIFWNHHEEVEGEWNWSGEKDLHAFVELCGKHGLLVVARLGPWAHGECRHGGFPDWLLAKCGREVRRDAEPYLSEVRTLYTQIFAQLKGQLWRDGGPVIGVQIENELTRRADHILTLKKMAVEIGFEVPLYTATGWMSAQLPRGEVLPMFAGYPDAFWAGQTKEWDRRNRKQYIFTHIRDDATIGADVAGDQMGGAAKASTQATPYLSCELGGGMAIAYRRRPVIEGDDVAALALIKLGCGSNLLGYYMYAGGANPLGQLSTLQESTATGYPNDLPVINYDFQAPVGQYGQRRASYHALRLLHLFTQDFGSTLAPLAATLPETLPTNLDDTSTLRWSARSDGEHGFLFFSNYQRQEPLPEKKGVRFELRLKEGALQIPREPVDLPTQTYGFWPFNFDLNGVRLRYATAQPLCRVGDTFVFFALDGVAGEFLFDPATQEATGSTPVREKLRLEPGQLISVHARGGALSRVLLLSRAQALQAYKATLWGGERLLLSQAGLTFEGDSVHLQTRNPAEARALIYPAPPALNYPATPAGIFTEVRAPLTPHPLTARWERLQPAGPAPEAKKSSKGGLLVPEEAAFAAAEVWRVTLPPEAVRGSGQAFLKVRYTGDTGRAYLGDRLIDDDFYFGRPWEIGLRRFAPEALEKGLTLKLLPLRKGASIYIPQDRLPTFGENGEAVGLQEVTIEPEYEVTLRAASAPETK